MKVLELKGYNSYKALMVFHTLMLGLKMLPEYLGETYESFFTRISSLSLDEQQTFIRQAALFVKLDPDEIESLICFTCDKNGIPYGPANLKNLTPDQIHDIIVAVCMEVVQIKINFVSEVEKKKYTISQSTSERPLSSGLTRHSPRSLISLFMRPFRCLMRFLKSLLSSTALG